MILTDPFFNEVYNEKQLKRLEKKFGPFQRHHLDLTVTTQVMLDMMFKMTPKKPRRAEVVMIIPNEQGQLWLHTKDFYPEGVYRLMTGGIDPGEKPDKALLREVKEETGFAVKIDRCLAAVTYTLTATKGTLPFASYVFLTRPTAGQPHPADSRERITHFKAVPVAELLTVVHTLRALTGPFQDWGIFRAIAHQVAYEALNQSLGEET
ncbi:MAG: NUDIX hydrolase [Anaerolineales bacterium]|nr:NUDIX hydrolase [Anaerolineales bacterium]